MKIAERIHPDRLLRMGIILGIALVMTAIVWRQLLGDNNPLSDWYPANDQPAEILLGSALGLAGAVMATVLAAAVPAIRRLREMLLEMIVVEDITLWHALAFGFLAGIPEEIFFRGALQTALGLVLAAVVFAGFHAISPLYFVYTLLAGMGLGWLAAWRGDLWAATAAHIVYDTALFVVFRWHSRKNHTIVGN